MANLSLLKQQYIEYYEDVPIQKYAAMAIGRDEDTVIRWKKEDTSFADAIKRAHAQWVRKKVIAVKAEFALERLQKEVFSAQEESPIFAESTQTDQQRLEMKEAFKNFVIAQIRARNQPVLKAPK
ncbi:MAG: hypothetical protein JWM52_617 [Candidatus Saccharibacteria bacterium]|nr:hypothetical protein [Candidatus Saccharibacteria bacterium]